MNIRTQYIGAAVVTLMVPMLGHAAEGDDTQSQGLETVIVTAERRAAAAQDVPISISTLSADAMASRGVREASDLATADPSISWQRTYNGSPYIRGVGRSVTTPGNQSSVPVYVDGVLLISPFQNNFAFNNVSQVEVLKGPQGTLFGRNSSGGLINITTPDPDGNNAGKFDIGYGNFDTIDAGAFGNVAINDNWSANLALDYHDQREGWGKNLFTGQDAFRDKSFDVRGKLRWAADESTDVVLTLNYSELEANSNASRLTFGTVGMGGTTPPADFYDTNSDLQSSVRTEVGMGSLRVSHEFGATTFRSITAYTKMDAYWPHDSDGGPLPLLATYISDYATGFTQELQFLSDPDKPLNWVAGLYYFDSDAGWDPILLEGSRVGGVTLRQLGHTAATSYAAYAQANWEFIPGTILTLGGRYTWDDREVDGRTDVVNGNRGVQNYQSADFQNFDYRATLNHHLADDTIVYVTAGTGFNSGQFNVGNAAAPVVQPEEIEAYEVGIKSRFADNRVQLNAAAFWYDYTDLQVTVTGNAVSQQTNAAAARIKGGEVELQLAPVNSLNIQIGVSYLDTYMTNYKNAQFFLPAPTGGYVSSVGDATGNRVRNAPEWSATFAAQYELDLAGMEIVPSVSYSYKDELYWDFQNALVAPPAHMLNASVRFVPASFNQMEIALRGSNLLGEKLYAHHAVRPEASLFTPAPPRTYGVSVEWHF